MTESCSGGSESEMSERSETERIVGMESVLETEYYLEQQWVVGMPELVVIVAAVGTGCGGLMLRLLLPLPLLLRRRKVRCVKEARFAREQRV